MVQIKEIKLIVGMGQSAISEQELRIACDCLIEQFNRLQEILLNTSTESVAKRQRLGMRVKIEGCEIGGRRPFNRSLFTRRELGLKLGGNLFRDFALNGKNVGEVAIIGLRPKVCVVSGVDKLRGYSYAISGALNTPFKHVGDAKLLANFRQVPWVATLIESRKCG